MAATQLPPDRYHALDCLRATMMLLGLVIHASGPYMQNPYLPDDPAATSAYFDVQHSFIHLFRMPVFFLLAGFFAALLLQKRGLNAFAQNRRQRVLYPLLVFGLAITLLQGIMYLHFYPDQAAAAPGPKLGGFPLAVFATTAHLWFLYFLLYLYAGTGGLVWLRGSARFPGERLSRALLAPVALPGWVLALAALLYPMPAATFFADSDLLPNWRILLGYGLSYGFGWLLHQWPAQLAHWRRYAWPYAGVGIALFGLYEAQLAPGSAGPFLPPPAQAWLALTASAATWVLGLGLIGLFVRYLNRPSATWRYLSDASYWVYLMHVPVCVWLEIMLARTTLPVALKFGIVLTVTAAVSLVTYDLLVRGTAIGQWLNGARHPPFWRRRQQPATEPLTA